MKTTVQRFSPAGALAVLLLMSVAMKPAISSAAENGVTGGWQIVQDFGGTPNYSMLTIAKSDDGKLTGKWNDTQLTNVKFEGDKLTFTRTVSFGGQENAMQYAGTLKDGKLTGNISSSFGEFPANAVRPQPLSPAVGLWKIQYKVMDNNVPATMTLSQKDDGSLAAKYVSPLGESAVSEIKFADGKLAFTRKTTLEGNPVNSTFDGTIKEGTLTGKFKGDLGEMAVTGQRLEVPLMGQWDLKTDSQFGPANRQLVVFPDLTGRYQLFDGLVPIKEIKVNGNQVSFKMDLNFGGESSTLSFKGKLDGNTLNGEMTSPGGPVKFTGKKVEKVKKTD